MIKMSPKYGVNPAKVVCFWCGGFTGRVVLLGHIKDPNDENTDIEAPDRIVSGYELCNNCKKIFESGVGIIEVVPSEKWKDCEFSKYDPQRSELINGLIPTGRFYVLKEGVFPNAEAGDIGFLTPEEFERIQINEDN